MTTLYNRGMYELSGGGAGDWDAGGQTYRVLLVTSAYTFDRDHDFVADLTSELSGGGYARQDLTGRATALNDTADQVEYSADNVSFTLTAQAPAAAIVYRFVSSDADSPLVAYCTFTAPGTVTGTFTVRWSGGASGGILFTGTSP
jgi:hypothetical protein